MCCGSICPKGAVSADGKAAREVMTTRVCSWEVRHATDKLVPAYLIVTAEEGVLTGVNVYTGFPRTAGFYAETGEGIASKLYAAANGYIKTGCDNETH